MVDDYTKNESVGILDDNVTQSQSRMIRWDKR